MPDQTLIKFVKEYLKKGYTIDQIGQALVEKGWTNEQVNEAMDFVESMDRIGGPVPSRKKSIGKALKTKIIPIVVVIIIILVIVFMFFM